MKRKIFALTLLTLLCFSGCKSKNRDSSTVSEVSTSPVQSSKQEISSQIESKSPDTSKPFSSKESSVAPSSANSEISDNQETSQETPAGQINTALELILGGEQLLDDSDQHLFMLKEYGYNMKWTEVNKLENLERGTPPIENEAYFLIVPKYTGMQITVHEVTWDDEAGELIPVETIYHNSSTPDQYGLIVTTIEPEGFPDLSVTVSDGTNSFLYYFTYDGKGDRPAIQLLGSR